MAAQHALTPAGGGERSDRPPLLTVDGLSVAYGATQVVDDVAFALERGRSLALIGESGSGKTTVARTILRLLPAGGRVVGGQVRLDGRDLLGASERALRSLRGPELGFVPQDPGHALNPVRSVGRQAHEAARALRLTSRGAERARILQTFSEVGLADPERIYRAYPHELSGGMLQRALIGLAVMPRPSLLIADEPTSGLDVTVQKVVLDLFDELKATLGVSVLFITHDLAVAAERADELVVLKDGAVQERGPSRALFAAPRSAYTRELQADVPAINPDRYRSVHVTRRRPAAGAPATQIELARVTKTFGDVTAVDDVSFVVQRGRTHALVGESGSGKTTTVRLLLGLDAPDAGEIAVGDASVLGRSRSELRALRRQLQLVYQNPFTSLDPTWPVGRIVAEPLDRYGIGNRDERRARVREAIAAVGLPEETLSRRPGRLSGGQRQRVAIARALVLRPEVLVLDEPTSALDVTVQAGIVDLLYGLQSELGLTYLFVSHDLSLVRQIADTVSVLRRGRVVESGPVEAVFADPEHEYTRALIDAIPAAPRRAGQPDGPVAAAPAPVGR